MNWISTFAAASFLFAVAACGYALIRNAEHSTLQKEATEPLPIIILECEHCDAIEEMYADGSTAALDHRFWCRTLTRIVR